MPNDESPQSPEARRAVCGLSLLFAVMYFAQGIGEPTEGLVGQPVKSLLADKGLDTAAVASFSALLAVPWMIKPLYGLLTDFVPLFGYRRRSYLLLATGATAVGLLMLFVFFRPKITTSALFLALLIPAVGIAMTDVVLDAVMVEQGRRYGMTGRFQSVQWAAAYTAPIIAAPIGGYLADNDRREYGFLICGLAAALSLALALLFVDERPRTADKRTDGNARATVFAVFATPGLPAVVGFLFLWNFNPFLNDVLYMYLTRGLGFDEKFYGWALSLMSASSVAGAVAYGFYCRRVHFGLLLHLSIALGVVSTLGYAFVVDRTSALIVVTMAGFAYMTAVLIQFDLMARACPPIVAGTSFALLMSVTNVSLSMAIALGGFLYEHWKTSVGAPAAFRLVVALGATCSIACWAFVPALGRVVARQKAVPPPSEETA